MPFEPGKVTKRIVEESTPEPYEKNLARRWLRLQKQLPTIAFFSGFVFDSATLGRRITQIDLGMMSIYALAGFIALVLERRPWREPRHHRWVVIGLQFFLGALFSATTVVYFKSSGHPFTFGFVVVLFGLMVLNEYLHRGGPTSGIVRALYALSLALVLNFVVPYFIGVVSWWLFPVALAFAGGATVGLQRLSKLPRSSLKTPFVVLGITLVFHLFGGIPPVPLVLKNNLVGVDFKKADGEYTVMVDEPGILESIGVVEPDVVVAEGETVWGLTAVFAPDDVEVTMEHRWYRLDEDGWKRIDTLNFEMRGGRKDGWRFYSRKRNISPGEWRLETALEGGAVLGYYDFEVIRPEDSGPAKSRKAL